MASTQQQQQNFRKTYYSSLGVKAVEVQPSLDAALKGSELQAEKLQRLCLWVRIPSLYRPLVWRVLLGALPPLKEAWADVEAQQDIEWAELQSCLSATDFGKGADELTARRLLQSVLLSLLPAEEGHSWSLYQITGSSMSLMHEYGDVPAVSCPYLVSLSQACLSIGAGPLETFVLLRGLLCKLDVPLWPRPEDEKKRISQTTARIDLMRSLLKEHDLEVSSKLESLGIDLIAACGAWFEAFFSNVLPPETLEGVWDILIAGETGILAHLGLSALLAVKRRIMDLRSPSEFDLLVQTIPKIVDPDGLANTAVNLWERPILDQMNNEEL